MESLSFNFNLNQFKPISNFNTISTQCCCKKPLIYNFTILKSVKQLISQNLLVILSLSVFISLLKGVPKKMFLFLKLSTEWSCNIIIIVTYLHLGSRSVNYCSEVFKTLTTCGLKLFLVLKRDA